MNFNFADFAIVTEDLCFSNAVRMFYKVEVVITIRYRMCFIFYLANSRKVAGKAQKRTRHDQKVVWVFTRILYIGLGEIYKFVFLDRKMLFFLSGDLFR